MRRLSIRIAVYLTLIIVIIALTAGWWALKQTQFVPEFYAQAIESRPAIRMETRRHLEKQVEQLQEDASRIGAWEASFSDDQINVWLIEELPKRFPGLLADGASEPRIVIKDGSMLAAVRYKRGRIDTVISCQLTIELTEQPNTFALHVTHLKAGALPLPLNNFLKSITQEAANGGIDIYWDETDLGPVGLVTIPSERPGYTQAPVIVESVRLVDGQVFLSGRTGPLASESYHPLSPVYWLTSHRGGESRSRQNSRLSSN